MFIRSLTKWQRFVTAAIRKRRCSRKSINNQMSIILIQTVDYTNTSTLIVACENVKIHNQDYAKYSAHSMNGSFTIVR